MRLGAEKPEVFFISVFKAEGGGNCSFTKVSSWLRLNECVRWSLGHAENYCTFFCLTFISVDSDKKEKIFFISSLGFRHQETWERVCEPGWVWQAGDGGLMDGSWQKIPAGNEILKFWTLQVLIFAQIQLMRDEPAGTETLDKSCSLLRTVSGTVLRLWEWKSVSFWTLLYIRTSPYYYLFF